MQIIKTPIPDVLIIEPKVFTDDRGFFFESFKEPWFSENVQRIQFIQDNESFSQQGTLRGMHYQIPPYSQSKLVRVPHGSVIDIVTDLREDSPTFRHTVEVLLSSENKRQLWIPRGFAHGFLVLSETALFQYKVDNKYSPDHERCFSILDLRLQMELPKTLFLSEKDKNAPSFSDAWTFKNSQGLYNA